MIVLIWGLYYFLLCWKVFELESSQMFYYELGGIEFLMNMWKIIIILCGCKLNFEKNTFIIASLVFDF